MDTLAEILAIPASLELITERLAAETKTVVFTLAPTSKRARCPLCQTLSGKIHSHYERTVADLNWGIYRVSWHLWVRKFFCRQKNCPRKVFTERIEGTLEPHARKTRRLTEKLARIGLALGGKAGEKLSEHLDLPTDRQTLLSYVSRMPTPQPGKIQVLGVDDWAYRSGKTYGTILVNLQTRKPVALLEDRKAETLRGWLKEHPEIEIVSRDRAQAYRSGAESGCPKAIQVVERRRRTFGERFHLVQNMAEVLESVFEENSSDFRKVSNPQPAEENLPLTLPIPFPEREKTDIAHSQARRARRLANYKQVHELHRQGLDNSAIARRVG